MRKFLQLVEAARPDNAYNDLIPLVKEIFGQMRQLYGDQVMYKSNGVLDVVYNNRKFRVTVKAIADEEQEQEVTEDDIDANVEHLASKARPGKFDPRATAAKSAVAKRTQLQGKAVQSFDNRTKRLEKALKVNP